MRILVLGGDGMLGHQLLRSWRDRHDVRVTLHREEAAYGAHASLFEGAAIFGIDVRRTGDVLDALARAQPEVVVNAVGIVKQRTAAQDAIASLELNALLPHRLAQACAATGVRLVHLSTDCVFSGRKGGYTEADEPDPVDLYGRTKLLGELAAPHCLTLRTSMVGLELARRAGLVEWFLAQRPPIRGYRRAVFSGLTTSELARAIEHLVTQPAPPAGLWHLASKPIDKHALLSGLAGRLPGAPRIDPDDAFVCDRSLDGSRLLAHTTYRVPPWDTMLDELAEQVQQREHER